MRENTRAKLFGQGAAPVQIGRHTIVAKLGAGGMGIAWRKRVDTPLSPT